MQRKNKKKTSGKGFTTATPKNAEPPTSTFNKHADERRWREAVETWKRWRSSKTRSKTTDLREAIYEGVIHMKTENYTEAYRSFCKGLAIDPNNTDAIANLGIIEINEKRHEKGLELCELALQGNKNIISIWCFKIKGLAVLGRFKEVDLTFQKAIEHGIERIDLLCSLAIEIEKELPDLSINLAKRAVRECPKYDQVKLLGIVAILRAGCCFDEERIIDTVELIDKSDCDKYPALALYALQTTSTLEQNKNYSKISEKFKYHIENSCKAQPLGEILVKPINDRPIRIGVISGDFYNHVVMRFLYPLLESLNSQNYEVICAATQANNPRDEMRLKLESIATFVNVDIENSRKSASYLRTLELDVCIDCAGFTRYGGYSIMAWRVAPLQITMYGFPGSIFVPNIDLLPTNQSLIPKETWMHSEELLMLNGIIATVEPLSKTLNILSEPPQMKNGFVSFGTLVNPNKYTASCISLWSETLKATPNSQFSIIRPECSSSVFNENIIKEFANNGIPRNRLVTVNNRERELRYEDCYSRLDVALDTAPMTGGTSTVDSVLMGVPTVSLEGLNYHQLLSKSILVEVGLDCCVASSVKEYIKKASELSQNTRFLKTIRSNAIRGHYERILCDHKRYSVEFEKALLKELNKKIGLGKEWSARLARIAR